MSILKQTELILEKKFDKRTTRHYMNGQLTVLHCHHYSTLYTQLAIDAGETKLLTEVSESTFYNVLTDYFENHTISNLADRVSIACQYYSAMGLGVLEVISMGENSGEIKLPYSHLDKGWITKWGIYDKPVNYISAGYINAMFSAVMNKPMNSFDALEISSIVKGDEFSLFKVFSK